MTLSVIIPIYKAEQTLDRCVESVLEQDVEGMEVILVNDGSPDRCPLMCDEWAKRDTRIKVLHKENGGPGSARNTGLQTACGDYVTFVDSDDYLLPETYRTLIERMVGDSLDMIEYSLEQRDSSRSCTALTDKTFDNYKEYWTSTKAWRHGYLCNKIFRREIIGDCRFPDAMICEDMLLLVQLLKHCGRISTTSHGKYVYVANPHGLSKGKDMKTTWGMLHAEAKAAWTMKTMPWDRDGRNLYYYICCRAYDMLRLSFGMKL